MPASVKVILETGVFFTPVFFGRPPAAGGLPRRSDDHL